MKQFVKYAAIPAVPPAPVFVTATAVAAVGILFAAGCASVISPTRPAAEVVPVTAYLSITNEYYYYPTVATLGHPYPPEKTVTITGRSTIAQIAKLINALPITTVSLEVPCPTSPDYDLVFGAAKNSPPSAEISLSCVGVFVVLHGQNQPNLGYGPAGPAGFLKSLGELAPSVVGGRPAPE
jgi:hypothetical protein